MPAVFSGLIAPGDARWAELLEQAEPSRVEHDFYHLPSYVAFCAARAGGRPVAFVHQQPGLSLLLPLILLPVKSLAGGAFHASCPYGYPGIAASRRPLPAAALREALQELLACLRAEHVITAFVRLHPLFELPLDALESAGTLLAHGQTVSIDLAQGLDQSWSLMRPTHRRHINAARRAGYVAQSGWEGVAGFLDCYRETMQRVGASRGYLLDREYVEGLREALGGHLQLWSVLRGDQLACAGLFSALNGIMQYHLGGTKHEFLGDSPMKLLFDAVRRWGHERQNRVLHLGGGVGGRADALFHFKAGFSERRHTFHTLRLVADPAAFRRSCGEAGVVESTHGHFPPFLALPPRL